MLKRLALLLGPIVYADLLKIARRKRWYVLRVMLGLLLLMLIYQTYFSWVFYSFASSGSLSHVQMRMIATQLFDVLLVCQGLAICFLAPVITAGAIAEEKQRKTLHYLLTSQMSSFEIVIGKLFSPFFVLVLPVAIALPVMVIVGLFGGIEPQMVIAGYGTILTVALFEASLAILMSTLAKRGRDALFLTFIAGFFWLIVPVMLEEVMLNKEQPWPDVYRIWIEPINGHLVSMGPLSLANPGRNGLASWWWKVVSMVIHQWIGIVTMLLLAVWQLRPAFRRQDGAPAIRSRWGKAVRSKFRSLWPRRPPGEDAMLWKETVGMPGSFLLTMISVITVTVLAICVYEPLGEEVPRAWDELLRNGYHGGFDTSRYQLSILLRAMNATVFCVASLVLASMAATSITREREDDTWISLVSTPLDGINILRAKLVGSLWAVRGLILIIALTWIFGLLIGVIHPVGVLFSGCMMVISFAFILGLGTLISLKAKTTMRAIGLTIGVLIFLVLILPMLGTMLSQGSATLPLISCFPFHFGALHLSYWQVDRLLSRAFGGQKEGEISSAIILGVFFYTAAAAALLSISHKTFDLLLDRPRRSGTKSMSFGPVRNASAAPKAAGPGASRAGRV